MDMARIPTVNLNLPKGMRPRKQKSGKTYYYLDKGGKPRKEIPLGDDYFEAIKKYADLMATNTENLVVVTLKDAIDAYFRSRFYKKLAARTKRDYKECEPKILEFFNDPPVALESLEASHIEEFMEWRGQVSERRANYEYSVISIVWNHARRKGMTNRANPCTGVPKFVLEPRDVYVDDDTYLAIYESSCDPVRDAMDLAYLTGQRPADVFKMNETDIKDGYLTLKQNKGKKKLRLKVESDLKIVIDRILARKKRNAVYSLALVCNEKGARISQDAVAKRFRKIREKVIINHPKLGELLRNFQFRDLRAKSATDIFDVTGTEDDSQKLLGHSDKKTTAIYIRSIIGQEANPTTTSNKVRSAIVSRVS